MHVGLVRLGRCSAALAMIVVVSIHGCADPLSDLQSPEPSAERRESVFRRDGFEYRAHLVDAREEVVGATLTIVNVSQERRSLLFPHTCVALFRAYFVLGNHLAWDQRDGKLQCVERRYEVVFEPGEMREFRRAVGSLAILGQSLPEGTYRITIYVSPIGKEEVELSLGAVRLARPDLP